MLHRLTATLIVIFWLCMTSLLVVREMYPAVTRLNDVPTSFVAQLVFQHQQPSDLIIYNAGRDSGFLHVQPRKVAETGDQILDFHGNLMVEFPGGGGRQRISWEGTMRMNSSFQMQYLRVRLGMAYPEGGGHTEILVEPPKNIARYTVKAGKGATPDVSELTLDEAGFATLMARAGIPAMSMPQLRAAGAQVSPPQFLTQTSSLQLNGETVSTFYYSIKMEEQVILEAHLSQLGQVLRAQIPLLSYKFAPQGVTP